MMVEGRRSIDDLASRLYLETAWKPALALLLQIAEATESPSVSLTVKLLAIRLASGRVLLPEAQVELTKLLT